MLNSGSIYRITPGTGSFSASFTAKQIADRLSERGVPADSFQLSPDAVESYVVAGPLGAEHKAIKSYLGEERMTGLNLSLAEKAILIG